ncbi:class I SAM-dependent methyltransferase [Candidatus Electrothrix sp.]|uniref:class I SAM-dependent methyltransferase n=1 Tax=Candidatus Electrothrix sp. TaxID=2170559 RepID=UPI0040560017
MTEQKEWDKRYNEDDLPWDSGMPETALINMITSWPKTPNKALDIGCGTGTNAVWLAEQGVEVTAMDISEKAVALAEKRCSEHGVLCRLIKTDFLTCTPAGQYDLLFDRGCFHCTEGEEERRSFVRQAAIHLKPGGFWLSLIGNKDQMSQEGKGPPRLSATEICSAVEPAFEILSLESVLKTSPKQPQPLRFWHCLMRKR